MTVMVLIEEKRLNPLYATGLQVQKTIGGFGGQESKHSKKSVSSLKMTPSIRCCKDEMAQSIECWPLDREIRVQLPAEESHSS
jgi:hypothetical protein